MSVYRCTVLSLKKSHYLRSATPKISPKPITLTAWSCRCRSRSSSRPAPQGISQQFHSSTAGRLKVDGKSIYRLLWMNYDELWTMMDYEACVETFKECFQPTSPSVNQLRCRARFLQRKPRRTTPHAQLNSAALAALAALRSSPCRCQTWHQRDYQRCCQRCYQRFLYWILMIPNISNIIKWYKE